LHIGDKTEDCGVAPDHSDLSIINPMSMEDSDINDRPTVAPTSLTCSLHLILHVFKVSLALSTGSNPENCSTQSEDAVPKILTEVDQPSYFEVKLESLAGPIILIFLIFPVVLGIWLPSLMKSKY
jgi:hypothetical protein